MPYINVSTSAKIEDKKKLLEEISNLVSSQIHFKSAGPFISIKVYINPYLYKDYD